MQRRKFSRELKLDAVRLVKDRGVAVAQACHDLDLHENVLRKWIRELSADPQHAFPGHGQMKPEQLEIERLRKEVAKLKAELPVLPFVFARAQRPFLSNGLTMMVGMAVTFALIATLAAVAGGWAVAANVYGRYAALVVMPLFSLALLLPSISSRPTRSLVWLGAWLSNTAEAISGRTRLDIGTSLLLGVVTVLR